MLHVNQQRQAGRDNRLRRRLRDRRRLHADRRAPGADPAERALFRPGQEGRLRLRGRPNTPSSRSRTRPRTWSNSPAPIGPTAASASSPPDGAAQVYDCLRAQDEGFKCTYSQIDAALPAPDAAAEGQGPRQLRGLGRPAVRTRRGWLRLHRGRLRRRRSGLGDGLSARGFARRRSCRTAPRWPARPAAVSYRRTASGRKTPRVRPSPRAPWRGARR